MRPSSPRLRARAFTLIEAMIVVGVVGILALIATVTYRRWVRTAYVAEAHDMLSNIRAAEESFRSENGTYLNVSGGLDTDPSSAPIYGYPAATPGSFKSVWGGACSTCTVAWGALNVESKAPVAFAYEVVSDHAVSNGKDVPTSITVDGTAMNATPPSNPAFAAEAVGDIDGNGVYCRAYVFSFTNQFFIDHEGE